MMRCFLSCSLVVAAASGCGHGGFTPPGVADVVQDVADLGMLAWGWRHELIARTDQSYAGWDVELADLDADGRPEILTGSAPDSRVYVHRRSTDGWASHVLADNLAGARPGMVLGLHVTDLDGDGRPELLAGTGQEDHSVAKLVVMHTDGSRVTASATTRAPMNTSSYTHGLATSDVDGDGRQEIISAYCPNGEVIRYDVDATTVPARSRKVLQLGGSGEDAWLRDVDGDADLELVISNGYRDERGRVEIYDLDPATGDPLPKPRIVLDSFDGRRMFYGSVAVGDIDGDGRPELIVGWKAAQDVNRASIVAYRIRGADAQVAYVLARDDAGFDLSFFEKMIAIADLDVDGRNEIVFTTRGDGTSEGIDSSELGHVYVYRVLSTGEVRRDLVLDFDPRFVSSSWPAIGDVDGDGRPDLVLATGKGDRRENGASWVLRLWRE